MSVKVGPRALFHQKEIEKFSATMTRSYTGSDTRLSASLVFSSIIGGYSPALKKWHQDFKPSSTSPQLFNG